MPKLLTSGLKGNVETLFDHEKNIYFFFLVSSNG